MYCQHFGRNRKIKDVSPSILVVAVAGLCFLWNAFEQRLKLAVQQKVNEPRHWEESFALGQFRLTYRRNYGTALLSAQYANALHASVLAGIISIPLLMQFCPAPALQHFSFLRNILRVQNSKNCSCTTRTRSDWTRFFLPLVFFCAGSSSNLLDRATRGYVVDYVEVVCLGYAFNLSDAMVSVAALFVCHAICAS
ncbi:unnamed protein product [Amoebophrya sp. A120]|nr:unnamed protein product [Amoebophrya sp. A120]|eukprot:GSA120T00016653001.1